MFSYLKTKFASKPQPVELPPPTAYEDPTVPLPLPVQPPRSPLLDQITDRTKKLIPKVSLKNILPSRTSRQPIRGETPSLEGFSYGRDSNDGASVSPSPAPVSPPSGHADSPDMIGARTPPPENTSFPFQSTERYTMPQRPSPPSSSNSSRDLPPLPSTTSRRSPLRESSQEETPRPTLPSFSTNRRSPPREPSLDDIEEIPRPSIMPSTTNRPSPTRDSSQDETPPPTILTTPTNRNSPPTDSIPEETPSPPNLPSKTSHRSLLREPSEETPPPTLPSAPPFAKIRESLVKKTSPVSTPTPTVPTTPRLIPSPSPRLEATEETTTEEVKTPSTPKPARRVSHFSLTEEIKKQPIPEVEPLPSPSAMSTVTRQPSPPKEDPTRRSSPPQEAPLRVVQPITVVRKISPAIRISEVVHQEEKKVEEPVKVETPTTRDSPKLVELEDYIKHAESDTDSEILPLPMPLKPDTVPRKKESVRTAWASSSPPIVEKSNESEAVRSLPAERKLRSDQPPAGLLTPPPESTTHHTTDRSVAQKASPLEKGVEKEAVRELPKPEAMTERKEKSLRRSSTIVYPNLHHFDDIAKDREERDKAQTKEIYVEERKSFRRTRRNVLEAALRQASDDREAQGFLETSAIKSVTHAIAFQAALNLIALTLQGFLSGLAVAHAVFAYVFADRDLLLKGYRWMSLPVHATFMVCFILGIMASVDRVRWHEFSSYRPRTWINAFGGLLQLIPMLIGLTASEMSLYFDESMAPVISTPDLPSSSINTWKILSTVRAGCAVFSWISVAFQPTNTAILEHIGMFMLPEDAREAHDYYKEAGAANLVESRIPTVFGGVLDQVKKNMMSRIGVSSVPADMSVLLNSAAVLSSNPTDLPQSIPQ
ncbi:jbts-14 [Pristionchus pacificus]|uniref:Jbts-14 n=1 Tax=Pristionchus pacificus TaxID=54126 RepID=A0A2A6BJR3_PRIPA|nr:jbts-14 [Pristionchus pacificus]|eukprot:PDM66127.1 jbts-14 [Pristionchus pacificus]